MKKCPACDKEFVGFREIALHYYRVHGGPLPIPSREKLEELYWEKGLTYREIAELYNRSDASTIEYWFKKYQLPIRSKSDGNSLARINKDKWAIQNGKWRPKTSKELVYVLGVMKGDGGYTIYPDKKGCMNYRIQLRAVDERFVKSFKTALMEIGISSYFYIDHSPSHCNHKKWKQVFAVFANCMFFVKWYKELTIEELEKELESFDCTIAFLKGFYESEGSLSNNNGYYEIRISNTDKDLLLLVQRLIQKLGFHVALRVGNKNPAPNEKVWYYVGMTRGREVRKLIRLMNPCIERKRNRGDLV